MSRRRNDLPRHVPGDGYYSVGDIARELGRDIDTIASHMTDTEIPHARMVSPLGAWTRVYDEAAMARVRKAYNGPRHTPHVPAATTKEGMVRDRRTEYVLTAVLAYYEIPREHFLSRRRDPLLVEARRVAIVLLIQQANEIFEEAGFRPAVVHGVTSLGRVIGLDHSTVLHHLQYASERRGDPDLYEAALKDIRATMVRGLREAREKREQEKLLAHQRSRAS